MQESMRDYINKITQQLRNESLHQHPELSFEEFQAQSRLCQFMESFGFQVERGCYGLKTAFKAVWQQGNPTVSIGFCSEFDALPEIGHACGHNLIAICGIGAALTLKDVLVRLNVPARIVLYGTPGEETTGGKILMAQRGAFMDIDVCLMGHPSSIHASMPQFIAMEAMRVEYFGKTAHAAASPWNGINALDAAVMAYQSVAVLRQQVHGVILEGGVRPNIIPDYTKMEFYVRSETIDDMNVAIDKVVRCFEGAAQATGCRLQLTRDPAFYNVKQNRVLADRYEQYMGEYGAQFPSKEDQRKGSGSTDMGNVSFIVPSIHPVFDIGARGFGEHTREFRDQAITPEAHVSALTAGLTLARLGLDCITDPVFLKQIKDTF
ncbi:hypothetical protein EDD86DRAFT_244024 [Gorgonomyces haynaldii]|nr:hypothetical protein EDD86DRAFT_244024 [Gorgonomyces haynaldii]